MKYCLSIGLHNLFFDLAIVDSNHKLISKHKCDYDRSKDIAGNIYMAYQKYYSKYKVSFVGVGVSNNIDFKDDILYKVYSFDFNRYNLKQSLYKLFKVDIYINDETYLAALASSYKIDGSLLYLLLDNRVSNCFVIDNALIELEEDIDLSRNEDLHKKCSKDAIKARFLKNNFDDDYIGACFLSNNDLCKNIVKDWAINLNKYLLKVTKELPVKNIVFAGYLGEYLKYYRSYMTIDKNLNCLCISNHREATLIGVSHLIFKDS